MALKKTITMNGDVFIKTPVAEIKTGSSLISCDSYIKVSSISATKEKMTALVTFSSEQFKYGKEYEIPVAVDDSSKNFIKQAYEFLKTLQEFSGAIDC